ncbi:dCTP deaminase domain-containing protein [Stenotrophomonas geniculata]|uniref:dCTP deaminase domain-containing protein n=1 Tax=Stenotrophomonas geniculata TaxID=86188 RepID=UPI002E7A0D57|nr:hypothetical protein [Stenotrophomonas geniculata]
MSVIEISRRISQDEKTFLDSSSSDKSLLYLKGGLDPGAYSIDLSVGCAWNERYGPTSSQLYRIPQDGLDIGRHGSIVIEVAEDIKVPHNMYGILVPTGSLFLDRGILIAPAKVEPSFSGHLKLRLFNTTEYKYCLRSGDKIASIVFFSTENTSFQPKSEKISATVDTKVPFKKRFDGWVSRNHNQLITWAIMIVCSSASAALFSSLLAKDPIPDGGRSVHSSGGLHAKGK